MAALPENDRITGPFIALAGQTDFPADFPLIKADGLRVRRQRDGVADVILEGVAVSAVDLADNGFTCRLAAGAVAGDRIWVFSQLPAARERAHINGGAVRTPTLEGDAVEAQAQLQELRRDLSLTVTVAPGETPPTSAQLKALAEGIDGVIELAEAAGAAAAEGKADKAGDDFTGPVTMPELGVGVTTIETGGTGNKQLLLQGRNFDDAPNGIGIGEDNAIVPVAGTDTIDGVLSLGKDDARFADAHIVTVNSNRIFVGPSNAWSGFPIPSAIGFAGIQAKALDGNFGIIGVSRASDVFENPGSQSTIGVASFSINDDDEIARTSYGGYDETRMTAAAQALGGKAHGRETNMTAYGVSPVVTPFNPNPFGLAEGFRVGAGREDDETCTTISVAATLANTGSAALVGLNFTSDLLDVSGPMHAIAMPPDYIYAGHRESGGPTEFYHKETGDVVIQGRNSADVPLGMIIAPGGGNAIVPSVAGVPTASQLDNGTVAVPWASVNVKAPIGTAGQPALSAPASYQKIYLENVPGVVEGSGGDAAGNAAALNAYILSKTPGGLTVYLRPRARYNMFGRLLFQAIDNVHFVCEGPDKAILYFPAAGLTNTYAAGSAGYYAANACPIYVRNRLGADGSGPATNITFQGIHIECEPAPTASRLLRPWAFRGVKNLNIYDCAASGFGMGRAFVFESVQGNSEADSLHSFGSFDDGTYGISPQMTAVEIDNNFVPALGPSVDGFRLRNIRAETMTVGSSLLAAWGYQTDAVHIVNNGTRNISIDGLYADGVGEGIDYYGDGLKASNLTFINNKIFAMTVKRGGRNAQFENFTAIGSGLQAIRVEGADERLVENNSFARGKISGIDPDGYWAGSSTSCVNISDTTRAFPVVNTSIDLVEMDPGPNGVGGWLSNGTGNNRNNYGSNVSIAPVNPALGGQRVLFVDGALAGSVQLRGTSAYSQSIA